MTKVTLLTPPEYIADATEQVSNATERVVLLAMVVADHPQTHSLIEALLAAAERGVRVYVAADVFTYGEVSGSFLPISYYGKKARTATNMGKRLKEAGVKFSWLGRSHMSLFSGRTHSKWCIIDGTVYSFGGVNVYGGGVENVDYMFRTKSKKLADKLTEEYMQIVKDDRSGRLNKSYQFDFENDHVLVDGGILGNSLIYRRACDLASSASSVVFVSQYPPTGKLVRILREKEATYYFNPPEKADFINGIVIRFSIAITKLQTKYKRSRYLHAKFILFYMPDGSRVALTGSHNYNYSGVALGTREIALETRNEAIIDQLEGFLKKRVV